MTETSNRDAQVVIYNISIVILIHFINVHFNSIGNAVKDANNEVIVYEYIVADSGPPDITTVVKVV